MLEKLARRFGFVSVEELKEAVKEAQHDAHIEADRERSKRALAEDELASAQADLATLRGELQHVVTLVPQPPLSNEEEQVMLADKLRTLGELIPA